MLYIRRASNLELFRTLIKKGNPQPILYELRINNSVKYKLETIFL